MKEWFSQRPQQEQQPGPEFWWDEEHNVFRRVYADAEDVEEQPSTSDFTVAGHTKYGPILKRTPPSEEDIETPNYSTVKEPEHFLGSLPLRRESAPRASVPIEEDTELIDRARRGFLMGGAAVASVAALSVAAGKSIEGVTTPKPPHKEEEGEREVSFESSQESPRFARELEGYEAFSKLRYDEVLFVDENNLPIGGPIPLHSFVIDRRGDDGSVSRYEVSPGPMDELGICTEGIAGEWIAEMRIKLKERYPDLPVDLKAGKPRILSINGKFKSVMYDGDDTVLQQKIRNKEVVNYMDIVAHYGSKMTFETGNLSVEEYIEQTIEFEPNDSATGKGVPPLVAAELKRIVPGLCAQESNFNNEAVSKSGARGIFQFMPATWGDYDDTEGGLEEGVKSLHKQVKAAGAFFSDLYYQVQHHAGSEVMERLRAAVPEETLQKDVLVPLVVNAYNAGGALIGEAVREYFARHPIDRNLKRGKDLYLAIADFAFTSEHGKYLDRYGKEAREYVPRIYANANVIHTA